MLLNEAKEKVHDNLNLPPEVKGLAVKKTNVEVYEPDDNDDEDWGDEMGGSKTISYDIKNKKGKKVGELSYEDYFGYVTGKLWGRDLPELSAYVGKPKKSGMHMQQSGALGNLHRFFKTKTGLKWLAIARKQNKIR